MLLAGRWRSPGRRGRAGVGRRLPRGGRWLVGATGDASSFATFLTRWLRTSWAPTDRSMRREAERGEHPYPGPISPVACALCARLDWTPPLADDVAPFVDERVVAAARQLHG